ncbi:MAG: tetratricopeptide repeat domain containing protein [Chlorobi bacterium]|nr:tetratricopeptide repeat domain containing protein [Chlorobiota bacterium]
MREISLRYDVEAEIPDQPEAIISKFPEWLAYVQDEQLVLVIDDLDCAGSLNGGAPDGDAWLAWLPAYIPSRVRLIVSVASESCAEELEGRGWKLLHMEPLSVHARQILMGQLLAREGLQISEQHLNMMSSDDNFANPLYLRTSLRELDFLRDLRKTMKDRPPLPSSVDELYDGILERLGAGEDGERMDAMLELLQASRMGLTAEELAALMKIGVDEINGLAGKLESDLFVCETGITFLQDQMRRAAKRRYAGDDERRRQLHRRLGAHFAGEAIGDRRAFEEPWQWNQARELEALRNCIVDIDMLHALITHDMQYDLYGYWHAITPPSIIAEYADGLARLAGEGALERLAEIRLALGTFLHLCGMCGAAESMVADALRLYTQLFGSEDRRTLRAHARLISLAIERKDADSAMEGLARDLFKRHCGVFGAEHPETIESQSQLGILLLDREKHEDAVVLLREVRDFRERAGGRNNLLVARALQELAMAERLVGNIPEARELLQRAWHISARKPGPEHPRTALIITELATLLQVLGETGTAIERHGQALAIRTTALGPDHIETAHSYNNLAHCHRLLRDFDSAIKYYKLALAVYERVFDPEHQDCGIILQNMGSVCRDAEWFNEAEEYLNRALAIFRAGSRHSHTCICMGNLGELYAVRGKFEEAFGLLHPALEINLEINGRAHTATANSFLRLSNLMYLMEDFTKSERLADDAVGSCSVAFAPRHRNMATALFYRARAAHAGNIPEKREPARVWCQTALQIFDEVGEAEQPHRGRARQLLEELGNRE